MDGHIILEPLNKDEALKLSEEIDALLGQISAHELRLASSYARLGGLLREVKNQQYWISYGYPKFSAYLEFIRQKIDRRRSQVYAILSVAETLLPHLSEQKLEEVGISKAHELKRLVKQGGNVNSYINVPLEHPVPQPFDAKGDVECLTTVQLMDYASDPKVTAAQLRVKVNELLHVHEAPLGNWVELGGFYALPDERKEIQTFWELGKKLLCPEDEQEDWVWKKQVFMDAVRESVSTWVSYAEDARQ